MIKKGNGSRAAYGLGVGTLDKVGFPKGNLSILVEREDAEPGSGSLFLNLAQDGKLIGSIDIRWFLYDEQGGPTVDVILHDEEPREVADILDWPDANYYRIWIRKEEVDRLT